MEKKSFYDYLINILKKDSRFIDKDGNIIRNAIIDKALKYDDSLLSMLIEDKKLKPVFFKRLKNNLIFLLNKFIDYIQDKNFLIDSYTKYKNKIGLTIDGKYLSERNEVALVWPFKDGVLEGGQTKEEQKRKEIFFNEVLAKDEIDRLLEPKVLTNFKRYTKKGEEKVTKLNKNAEGIISENLIIKGNNLLTLQLLKNQFTNKIKFIYIDPPFNKKADTFYNDNFKRSTWLTFMKNRLETAYELLKKEGAIFIHIDDEQFSHLKILCDEIFDEANLVNVIVLKSGRDEGVKMAHKEKKLVKYKEYILFYAKNKDLIKIIPQYKRKNTWDDRYNSWLERGGSNSCKDWRIFPLSKKLKEVGIDIADEDELTDWKIDNSNNIIRLAANSSDLIKETRGLGKIVKFKSPRGLDIYAFNGQKILFANNKIKDIDGEETLGEYIGDLWTDISYNNLHNEGGVDLPNGKKPEELIKRIADLITQPENGDIILDYHIGCGTTPAVAHKLGFQYIGVEQLDYGQNDAVHRLRNVINGDSTGISKAVNWQGGGSFIFCELKKYNEEFIDRIQSAKSTKELLEIWEDMKKKSFLNYQLDIKKQEEALEEFKILPLDKQKQVLVELLDKNALYVPLADIDDKEFKVSGEDKELNKQFYG